MSQFNKKLPLNTDVITIDRAALWPNYAPPDMVFTHGIGSELFTQDGVTYLDFLSGIAVNSFGHAHPHLVKTLQDQSKSLWHISNLYRIPEGERLARRLTELGAGQRVFFTNSGTEAVEAGIKAMRGYHARTGNPGRTRIIGFTNSFHGRTLAALAAAGNASHMKGFIPCDYGFDQVEWENLVELKKAITDETAGIILEPVQGEGGICPISKGFLKSVKDICQSRGLLLMFDEVQSGVGRTGKLFAYEHYGISPDIITLAKGLGGGFPVGACITSEDVGLTMGVGTHASTFGGNPLAMAVANAVLDLVLEDGLLNEVTNKGETLISGMEKLVVKFPNLIKSVNGIGLMIGVDCVISNGEMVNRLRDNRLIVSKAGGNSIRLLPALNVSSDHVDQCLEIVEKTLLQLNKQGS